jgi:drug/metabolite transporter (DMT)-like permease
VDRLRISPVDMMLLGTILLWALNVTVTRYLLTHGFRPIAYASIRYFAATSLFWGFTWQRERSFRIRLSDAKLVALSGALLFVNQLFFVSALHLTTASTVGLVLGTTPVFVGAFALLAGIERPARTFWFATAVSFLGVSLIAGGSRGGLSGDLLGDLLAIGTAASWSAYSVSIAPLMRRYSPFRISALVLVVGWIPLVLVSIPQLDEQSFAGFHTLTWLAFAYAVVGPLFLTNILWFTAIDRVGPSRASLFANLQPFFAVLFALVLLSEHLNSWEIAGGFAIAVGIVLERVWHRPVEAAQPVPAE